MNHAFCFSQSKEFTNAFEFLICLLLIVFSVQKSFQKPTKPLSLVEKCKIQNHCAAVINVVFFGGSWILPN